MKCSARSMDGLAKTVLRDALIFETQPVDAEAHDDEAHDDDTTEDNSEHAADPVAVEVGSNGRMYA